MQPRRTQIDQVLERSEIGGERTPQKQLLFFGIESQICSVSACNSKKGVDLGVIIEGSFNVESAGVSCFINKFRFPSFFEFSLNSQPHDVCYNSFAVTAVRN